MKLFLKKHWLIIAILLIAAFLRIYKLDTYPALNADEAAIGYNAYSLIETGKDEHGRAYPVHFQSFNDWKPGAYFYIVLPFVKFMGLTVMSVRLPNAIIAVLTVVSVYFFVKVLFPSVKTKIFGSELELSHVAAFFLAISPWHLHFSRGGWEVGTATFLVITGVTLILYGLKYEFNFKYLFLGLSLLILSLYTYHAARVLVPLLAFGYLFIYRQQIFIPKNKKRLLILILLSFIVAAPLVKDLLGGDVFSRAAGVGLFADKGPINRLNEQRGEHGDVTNIFAKLVHNKPVNYGLAFLKNWAMHFQGEFLFFTGDSIQRNKVPETGVMYLIDILFIALGLVFIAKNHSQSPKPYLSILWWLVVAPVAAALTFQAPHALRAENMVIPLVVISSFGFIYLINLTNFAKSYKFIFVVQLIVFAVVVWGFSRYLHQYYVHMAKEYPYSSQYGVKELVEYIQTNQDKYQDIVVTTSYDQPYILFLFYLKYPPSKFQGHHSLSSRDEFGFSTVNDFDKFHFANLDYDSLRVEYPNSLIVGTKSEIPKEANVVKKIYGSNGFEYFNIVAN